MAVTNHERVGKALDLLKAGLGPFIDREVKSAIQEHRVDVTTIRRFVDDPAFERPPGDRVGLRRPAQADVGNLE